MWGRGSAAPTEIGEGCPRGCFVLAHTSTGLCEIKPSPCDVFAAANPRAKTPDEIQTRCLNPGPDTAASTPSLCVVAATRWASFSAGTEGEQVPRGRVEPPAQLISIVLQAPSSTRHPPGGSFGSGRALVTFPGGGGHISWGHLPGRSRPGCHGGSRLGCLGEEQGFLGLCGWEGAGRRLKDPPAPAQSSGACAGSQQDAAPPSSHPRSLLGISINVSTSPAWPHARPNSLPEHLPPVQPQHPALHPGVLQPL